MEKIDLCDPECEGVILPALPAAGDAGGPRKNPHAGLQVSAAADAYLDLEECGELVGVVLTHLTRVLANNRLYDPGPIPLSWDRALSRHGVCKIQPVLFGRFSFALAFNQRAFERTTPEARAQTVIHESCHVVAAMLGERGHGPAWKKCMELCGVKPDVYASTVEGAYPTVTCPNCKTVSSVSAATAARMQRGGTRVICRKCGTYVTGADVHIPEHSAKKVASAAKRAMKELFTCPCGNKLRVPSKYQAAIRRGESVLCKCKRPITAADLGDTAGPKRFGEM